MVSFKGNQSQVSEDRQPIKKVSTRGFKVYSDNNERINVLGRESSGKTDTKTLIGQRKSLAVSRGSSTTASSALKGSIENVHTRNVRGAFTTVSSATKGSIENVHTRNKTRGSAVKVKVGRKVLADVSNVRSTLSRNLPNAGVKPEKGKSETSSLSQGKINTGKSLSRPRVSVARSTMPSSISSRKVIMGTLRTSASQVADPDTSNKVNAKGFKIYADNQKPKVQIHECFNTTGSNVAGKAPLPTRRSLPVTRRSTQGNVKNSEKGAGSSVKVKVTCARNERSYLFKDRASDSFIPMIPVDQSKNASGFSKKPLRPIRKSALTVSGALRNSKSISGSKKPSSPDVTSGKSQEEIAPNCVPKNIEFVLPREYSQNKLPSDGSSSSAKTDNISMSKCTRRKSFTSSLVARSEVFKVCAEVTKHGELPPIDDKTNHLEVVEYVDDIYQYYWVMEAENPSLANYMAIQTDITPQMRGILINWLIEVHLKFDLMEETLFLMVMLFDRFLSISIIKKNDMQLVGLTALLLASKYEDFWHPKVRDLISIAADSYTRDQMLSMEKLILKKLMFRLNAPTPYVFMIRFLKASKSDAKLNKLAFYLIELCLVEYEALKFKPSLLCASAIYVARCTLRETPAWTPLLARHSNYEEPQLRVCANMILRFHKGARKGQLKVAYEKYMHGDHGGVAEIKPLDRLPQ